MNVAIVNPLRDEPDPRIVGAVRRFGLAGLIGCALLAGLARLLRRPFDVNMTRINTPDLGSESIAQRRQ